MNGTIFRADDHHRIRRFEVLVDGQWHVHNLGGDPLFATSRQPDVVEFWAVEPGDLEHLRAFIVVCAGQPFPEGEDVRYAGAAVDADGRYVWHLLERWPDGRGLELAPAQPPDSAAGSSDQDAEQCRGVVEALVALRRQRGLSQREVALRMGTAQSAISDLERGKHGCQISTAQRYARAVGAALTFQVDFPRDEGGSP